MTQQQIALDIHTHLVPIEPDGLHALNGLAFDPAREVLEADGHTIGLRDLFRPQALIDWMDANRIARAFISLPPLLYRPHLAEADAERWCAYVNDGLRAIAAQHKARLSVLCHLPVEHPALAQRIATACIAQGCRRFAMATGSGPHVFLSDSAYGPLWHTLDAVAAFLFLHPGEGFDPRLDPFYLQNLAANPFETAVAATHLILGGVVERHPQLMIGLAHGGGATSALAARLARGYATKRPGVDTTLQSPTVSLRNLWVDCVVHDAPTLALVAQVHGANRILFGSDWPFPMGLPSPHIQLAGTEASVREQIFGRNADALAASEAK